jgi:hypothetical protein
VSSCQACAEAASNHRTGLYTHGCMQCEARALAQSPAAHVRERDPSAIQRAMRATWPDEGKYRRGRSMVWAWIKRLEVTT